MRSSNVRWVLRRSARTGTAPSNPCSWQSTSARSTSAPSAWSTRISPRIPCSTRRTQSSVPRDPAAPVTSAVSSATYSACCHHRGRRPPRGRAVRLPRRENRTCPRDPVSRRQPRTYRSRENESSRAQRADERVGDTLLLTSCQPGVERERESPQSGGFRYWVHALLVAEALTVDRLDMDRSKVRL